VKKHAPGLKCRYVSLASGSEGANEAFANCQPNTTNFLLLNPDFFFDVGVSGPAQKAVLVPFFWGGFYGLFFLSKLFFNRFPRSPT
jgi:hypothetical protein